MEMTRTQELLNKMRKLGFEKNAKELEELNEKWKDEGEEQFVGGGEFFVDDKHLGDEDNDGGDGGDGE